MNTRLLTASRVREIALGFGDRASREIEGIDSHWLLSAVILLTVCVIVGACAGPVRRWGQRRDLDSGALERDLFRWLRLKRRHQSALRQVARQAQVEHVATLLLCPSLLRQARQEVGPRVGRQLDEILWRLTTQKL